MGQEFARVRGGTNSPFAVKFDQEAFEISKERPVALKTPQLHPLDDLEEVLPDRLERKYKLFKSDLFDMFPKDQNNLAEIEMRQKEVSLFAQKHKLRPSLIAEWPANLIFYLIIFERMSKEEVLGIKNYEQLGWSPEVLREAKGISESLEFKREIYAYKGILESVLAGGGVIQAIENENLERKKNTEPKKSWVDELRRPSSEKGQEFSERVSQWSKEEQSSFHRQVKESNYTASEIDEMISGRDFQLEEYDY